jgi:hypothetical protein
LLLTSGSSSKLSAASHKSLKVMLPILASSTFLFFCYVPKFFYLHFDLLTLLLLFTLKVFKFEKCSVSAPFEPPIELRTFQMKNLGSNQFDDHGSPIFLHRDDTLQNRAHFECSSHESLVFERGGYCDLE